MDITLAPIVRLEEVWIPLRIAGIHNTNQLRQVAGARSGEIISDNGEVITYNHALAPHKAYSLILSTLEIAQGVISQLKRYSVRFPTTVKAMVIVYYREPEVHIPSGNITSLNDLWSVIRFKYTPFQPFQTELNGKIVDECVPLTKRSKVRVWAYRLDSFTLRITDFAYRSSVAVPCSNRVSTITQLKSFLGDVGVLLTSLGNEPMGGLPLTIVGGKYEYNLLLEDPSRTLGLAARLLGLYQDTPFPKQTVTLHLHVPIQGEEIVVRVKACDNYHMLDFYLEGLTGQYPSPRVWTRIYEDGKRVTDGRNIPNNAFVEVQRFCVVQDE